MQAKNRAELKPSPPAADIGSSATSNHQYAEVGSGHMAGVADTLRIRLGKPALDVFSLTILYLPTDSDDTGDIARVDRGTAGGRVARANAPLSARKSVVAQPLYDGPLGIVAATAVGSTESRTVYLWCPACGHHAPTSLVPIVKDTSTGSTMSRSSQLHGECLRVKSRIAREWINGTRVTGLPA